MNRILLLLCLSCCLLSALSLAEERESKPAATVEPADQFNRSPTPPETTTTTPKTTTTTPKTTTTTTISPNTTTTTPKTTTTTPKTTTTTTISPNTTTTTPKTTTTTPKTTTTTTTTTITTISPNTTTISPNTTTISPNTTTISPNTTTISPNTTTISPNTTTISPNTTTISPDTTTAPPAPPQPTPSAKLAVGTYHLNDTSGSTCVLAQMALQIRLATPQANGTFIIQPNLTHPDGKCGEKETNFTLVFTEGIITFMFNKSDTEDLVYVNALSFNFSYAFSAAGHGPHTANNNSVRLFVAKIGHSYSCQNQTLDMGNGLYLDVTQDRMQAYGLHDNIDFGSPDRCAADLPLPDYRVAIAVGVTLLVLILVVVVVYLVGRKRRSDGYQSL